MYLFCRCTLFAPLFCCNTHAHTLLLIYICLFAYIIITICYWLGYYWSHCSNGYYLYPLLIDSLSLFLSCCHCCCCCRCSTLTLVCDFWRTPLLIGRNYLAWYTNYLYNNNIVLLSALTHHLKCNIHHVTIMRWRRIELYQSDCGHRHCRCTNDNHDSK